MIGKDGQLHTSIYDKRYDFNFHIINFPFPSSNITSTQPMAFLSLSLKDTPGLAPQLIALCWGPSDLPIRHSNRDTSWNAWIGIQEVLWSIRWSYSAICSLPLTNVKWHSDSRPATVTSQPFRFSPNLMTLIPSLTFIELRVVSGADSEPPLPGGTSDQWSRRLHLGA